MRQYCISAWSFIDPLYVQFTRLQHIKKTCGNQTMMRVRLTKYKGRNIVLADGTAINKNDVLVKIHLHNVKLLRHIQGYDSEVRKALMIYKGVQDSLPSIAHYIYKHRYANDIKGLIGISMLYKGCKKLGFEPHSITNRYYKYFKQLAFFPIYFLSTKNTFKKEIPTPMYLFMSKESLFQQYGIK
ncbi:hypothetical protein KHA95_17925 [Bacillus sp. FJAT-50079]|nr:hypothetical protein [Bacillus sp. FJAT-50079]